MEDIEEWKRKKKAANSFEEVTVQVEEWLTVSTAHSPVQRGSRCVFANKTLLQERLELSTFAFLCQY